MPRRLIATLSDTVASIMSPPERLATLGDASMDRAARAVQRPLDGRVSAPSVTHDGLSSARKIGLARARGEFIPLLDADDCWSAGRLDRQLSILDSSPSWRSSATLCDTSGLTQSACTRSGLRSSTSPGSENSRRTVRPISCGFRLVPNNAGLALQHGGGTEATGYRADALSLGPRYTTGRFLIQSPCR